MLEYNVDSRQKPPITSFIVVLCSLILLLLFLVITSIFTARGYEELMAATSAKDLNKKCTIIVLDAGHGGEDPGAVANGVIEKNINLSMTLKLKDMLALSDAQVILTRYEDKMLYGEDIIISKKNDDLTNRAEYALQDDGRIFVSLHCNKFAMESQKGLQTFYSQNNKGSQLLAESIQTTVRRLIMPQNKRLIKQDDGNIFILQKAKCKAVLVECGFISNKTEAAELSDDEYRSKLAYAIYIGIFNYTEEDQSENSVFVQ